MDSFKDFDYLPFRYFIMQSFLKNISINKLIIALDYIYAISKNKKQIHHPNVSVFYTNIGMKE